MPDLVDTSLGLFAPSCGLEPADYIQPPGSALSKIIPIRRDLGFHRYGDEDCGAISTHHAVKAARSHANDCEWVPVDGNALIDDLRSGVKPPLPIVKAEHRDWVAIFYDVIRRNQ
jgi:hypothetical protein